MSLFRPQVKDARFSERLYGNVHLALPLSWHLVGGILGCAFIVAVAFVCLGSYSRIETVQGVISTDLGVLVVSPQRTGVLQTLLVNDGQEVKAGQIIARLSTEDMMVVGGSAQEKLMGSIDDQKGRVQIQLTQASVASSAEQARYRTTIAGLQAEVGSLDERIVVETEILSGANEDYLQVQELVEKGFYSKAEIRKRRETLLTHRKQIVELNSTRASKISAIAETKQSALQSEASAKAQIASLNASLSELTQHGISTDSTRAFSISAPVAGKVTAITSRVGQVTTPQMSLMHIVPSGSIVTAELYVPTSAMGTASVGNEVRLAVDAYPFHKFGTLRANISHISATTILRNDEQGLRKPIFLVSLAISQDSLREFSKGERLLPGMTLVARIATSRERIVDALIAPILSIGKQ